jgi:hypothetical protein
MGDAGAAEMVISLNAASFGRRYSREVSDTCVFDRPQAGRM